MNEIIEIVKKPNKKQMFKCDSYDSIPNYLKNVVSIDNDNIILQCLEGEEKCPIGSYIAFEQLEDGRWNVWNKANAKEQLENGSLIEMNGEFLEKPKNPNKAFLLTNEIPEIFNVKDLKEKEDGSFSFATDWGEVSAFPNEAYAVIYGTKEDGTLDANFLTVGTPSFENYFVAENGELICPLSEHYNEQMKKIKGKHI